MRYDRRGNNMRTRLLIGLLLLAVLSTAAVSAEGIWFLDTNDDGLIDDTNGDGRTNLDDVLTLYDNRNMIVDNYPDKLPMFDYNGDGVTNMGDLKYAYYHTTGKTPPKTNVTPTPTKKPVYYISTHGNWYPNGAREEIGFNEPSWTTNTNIPVPKMNRPMPTTSGYFPPLKRW